MKIYGIFEPDWVWTLPMLTAWLWGSGGSGLLLLRRFGAPLAISLYAYGYGVTNIDLLILIVFMLAVITVGPGYGDKFEKSFGVFYWPYIFVLGFLYGFCQLGISLHTGRYLVLFLSSGLCSFTFGFTMYGSKNFDFPRWKWAEMITGGVIGLTGALLMR